MRVNLLKIESFYKSGLGVFARRQIRAKIEHLTTGGFIKEKNIVCSAGSYPYTFMFKNEAMRLALQSYSKQDLWPLEGAGHYVITQRDFWPYRAEEVDCVFMIHDLEFSDNPEIHLRECWRVLKGEGHLFIVVPSRSGRWASHDNTPFGKGYPYSLDQIEKLLKRAHFAIDRCEGALYFPPYEPKTAIGKFYRQCLEKIGGACFQNAGIYIIEASKHIYAPTKGLREVTAEKAQQALFPGKATAANRLRRDADKL